MNEQNDLLFTNSTIDPIKAFVDTRGEAVLRWIIYFIAASVVFVSLYIYRLQGAFSFGPLVLYLLTLVVVLWLLRTNRFRWAFLLFITAMVATALYRGFTVSGLQTPALLFLPFAAMLSGWLLGSRFTWGLVALVIAGLAVLAWMQQAGQIPSVPLNPSIWALSFGLVCTLGAAIGIAMSASVREQYARAIQLNQKLVELNSELDAKVAQRTQDLQEAMAQLRAMQEDLIQSEKLASLGSMVAGISHELNTPIGN